MFHKPARRFLAIHFLVIFALFIGVTVAQPSETYAAPSRQANLPNLNLYMSNSGFDWAPGEQITYQLRWVNWSDVVAHNVAIVNALPTGLTFISATQTPETVIGNILKWNVGTLNGNGSGGSVTVTVRVDAAIGSHLTNSASISLFERDAYYDDNYTAYAIDVSAPWRDVGIWERIVPIGIFGPSSLVQFQLGMYSRSNASTHDVVVTDTLPPGMEYVTTTLNNGFVQNGQELLWNLGTLPPYTSTNWYVTARILTDTLAGSMLTNTVGITTTDQDSYPDGNYAQAAFTVAEPTYDLQVIGQPDSSSNNVFAGRLLTYTILVANQGIANATNAKLVDTLPFDTSNVVSVTGQAPYTLQGNQILWDLGVIEGGLFSSPISFTVSLRVPNGAQVGTVLTNTVMATLAEIDGNLVNNTAVMTSTVVTPTVGLQANIAPPFPPVTTRGQLVTYGFGYVISRQNNPPYDFEGNSWATGVRLTYTIPASMSFVTSTATVDPIVSGNTVLWQFSTSPCEYCWVSVVLKVDELAPGGIVTSALAVSSNENELTPANNITTSTIYIVAPTVSRDIAVASPTAEMASSNSALTLAFAVVNTGATTDTFVLDYVQGADWADLTRLPKTVTLAAGQATAVNVHVFVSGLARIGDVYAIGLTATSLNDDSKSSTGVTTITVNKVKVFLPVIRNGEPE